ncbi:hypothetical protein COCCADRAFT_31043 [Bipolaris zeicola 26-R-13]|uniref:C2H2-type domain-containing protein n=1 Tax=Cochliobolus carbonum (strain 26-R-13) TaxID=930089 RepID=W6XXM1_COCC2|nr:uncharacterized protein COCCADRAFT_31043 [Bipolaris zeicola 26-R-13]EUC27489.1 hypothetical protein COCCADRAFT_31043 [Bipolaris zeicola 26-R-13]
MCRKCEQKFCSEKAMVQHHDAPSHLVMFSCNVCKRPFASKQAMKQHKRSPLHARTLTRENLTAGYAASASLNPKKASSYQTEPRTQAAPCNSIKEGASSGTDNWGEYSDKEDARTEDDFRAAWGEDQNWALCDTDCGGCGHCVDGVDY